MTTITFKLHERAVEKIDGFLGTLNFNNRTEFIREAIRDKLNKIETERFMKRLAHYKGTAKVKVSDEKLQKIREDAAKKYVQELGISLD